VALTKRLVNLLKLVFVAGLMVFVFLQVPFEDRLVYRQGNTVAESKVIDIEGSWQADPLEYRFLAKRPFAPRTPVRSRMGDSSRSYRAFSPTGTTSEWGSSRSAPSATS
jgi:hypothetical protein